MLCLLSRGLPVDVTLTESVPAAVLVGLGALTTGNARPAGFVSVKLSRPFRIPEIELILHGIFSRNDKSKRNGAIGGYRARHVERIALVKEK